TRRRRFFPSRSRSRSFTQRSTGSSADQVSRRGPSLASPRSTGIASPGTEGVTDGLLEAGVHGATERQAAFSAGDQDGRGPITGRQGAGRVAAIRIGADADAVPVRRCGLAGGTRPFYAC